MRGYAYVLASGAVVGAGCDRLALGAKGVTGWGQLGLGVEAVTRWARGGGLVGVSGPMHRRPMA